MFTSSRIYLVEGKIIRDDANPAGYFNCLFPVEPNETRYFMDGSKSPDLLFASTFST